MHLYRYRPCTEITLKELLYNEIYFSSPEECNDPFDSKAFYVFTDDKDSWKKLIRASSGQAATNFPDQLLESLASHICNKCPLSYDEILNMNLLD